MEILWLPVESKVKHVLFSAINIIGTMMNRFTHTRILIFLLSLGLLLPGCGGGNGGSGGSNPTPPEEEKAVKGLAISPQGFPLDYSGLANFYAEVGSMPNGGVLWNGAWRDDAVNGTDAGAIPAAAISVMQNSTTYNFEPVVVFGWRSESTLYLKVPANQTNDWANTEAKNLFQNMVVNLAATYRPAHVFLGNENDFYYEQNPLDYGNWIIFYNAAYDAIETASPSTFVGPVFNFEHLSGSGALNGWTRPHWGALDSHDLSKVDMIGVTLYPWLNYRTASSVPANYLDPLISRIGSKSLAITETGWPAENLGNLNPSWETNETAQVTYLSRLSGVLAGKNPKMVNWLFLYPMVDPGDSPSSWKLFGSVSLRESSGNKRAVYDPWVSFVP